MYLKVRDARYWVEQYGEGEPILFLHGFTGSANTWHALRSFFSGYHMILIDLPGHGKTEAQTTASMEDCCNAISAILKELGTPSVHIIGYSMGGRTALSFAHYHPDMVKSLVIESASPGLKDAKERTERKKRDKALATFLHEHSIHDFVDKWENLPLFSTQKKLPAEKRSAIRKERLAQSPEGLAHSLLTMGTGLMLPLWDYLERIEAPCLLIVGREDHKFVHINKKMEQHMPNSKLVVVRHAGHAIHVEQLKMFATIVEEFIKKQEANYDSRMD